MRGDAFVNPREKAGWGNDHFLLNFTEVAKLFKNTGNAQVYK